VTTTPAAADALQIRTERAMHLAELLGWEDVEKDGRLDQLVEVVAKLVEPGLHDWAELAAPVRPDEIAKKPQVVQKDAAKGRCGETPGISRDGYACAGWHAPAVHIDYMGHAALTTRLNTVAGVGNWDWEPMAVDQFGLPVIRNNRLWIRLTIWGVTRLGVGDDEGGSSEKVMIGDALRNAAMRFGIGTDLWDRSEAARARLQAEAAEADAPAPQRPQEAPARPPATQRPTDAERAARAATTPGLAPFQVFARDAVAALNDASKVHMRSWWTAQIGDKDFHQITQRQAQMVLQECERLDPWANHDPEQLAEPHPGPAAVRAAGAAAPH
jgi:hypothetical protein